MPKLLAVPLDIPEVLIIKPRKFADNRGSFVETYNANDVAELGIRCAFVQDNQALSIPINTVRGLHFQRPPMSQAKLVRVLRGAIFDAVVDIRRGSPTCGRWCAATLTAEGGEQLFVPHGFAHAYCTLESNTEVFYKVDHLYSKDCDAGILWNDPTIGISWPIAERDAVLSEKDRNLPLFVNFNTPFQA